MKFDFMSLLSFTLAVTLLMAGNTASGVMKARKDGSFNRQELIDGVINYALWLATIVCLIAATQIYGGNLQITLWDSTYTLDQAVEVTKTGVYIVWAVKLIQNVSEYAGIKRQVDMDKIVENANKVPNIKQDILYDEGQG